MDGTEIICLSNVGPGSVYPTFETPRAYKNTKPRIVHLATKYLGQVSNHPVMQEAECDPLSCGTSNQLCLAGSMDKDSYSHEVSTVANMENNRVLPTLQTRDKVANLFIDRELHGTKWQICL
jgi:hypothetical protein